MGGLLARPALAVDRRAGHDLGPAGGEHGVAGDVEALLADLHHAAHHDVVDDAGIEAGAVDERLQRLGGEVDGVPVLELAVALAERGADGVDDHGSSSRRAGAADRWPTAAYAAGDAPGGAACEPAVTPATGPTVRSTARRGERPVQVVVVEPTGATVRAARPAGT